MIGDKYWSTGIIVQWRRDKKKENWTAHVKYFDSGCCKNGSTEGILRMRYWESDLDKVVDTIKADAEKLGIEFVRKEGLSPYVCMEGDGEIKGKEYPEGWRKIIDDQARRIGWDPIYEKYDNQETT